MTNQLADAAEKCALHDFDSVEMVECKWALWQDIINALRAVPAATPLDRERIAAVLYVTRYPNKIWMAASGMETAVAYEQADAMLALCAVPRPDCGGAA